MTENEAIEELKTSIDLAKMCTQNSDRKREVESYNRAIQALEEIQQYREIGTVEEIKAAMKYMEIAKMHGTVGKAIDACAEYEAIGTIDEFKALKEKKPISKNGISICPTCGALLRTET